MGKHVARPEDVISIINWYEEIIKNLKKKIIDMLYRKAIYLKNLKEKEKIFETNNTSNNISAWKTLHCLLTVLKAILKWLSRCAKRTAVSSG